MQAHSPSGFRPDINGLRAWAVVAVVLYHFGIPGFGGGFVGVDVFFVISGFLMTGIVVKGLERGSFSLLGFYMARGRRILPALIALCAVLLVMGWFVLLPPDYKRLSTHSVYAITFLSNVEFWQEAGYFDVASHEKWLLHTWSLSVEWQFYLILPIVLWVVWRIKPGRSTQIGAVALGLLVSLAASVVVVGSEPSAAFYLLHTRAWEMLAGGLVFLLADKLTLSVAQRRGIEAAGLMMIVTAIVVFDKSTTWPGWRAMLPVVAAMLVLLSHRNAVWTGSRLCQWLGDRSYSLYLWHWPLVVVLTYFSLAGNAWAVACALLATVLLGHLSYVWVENISRRWLERQKFGWSSGSLVVAAVAVALPAVCVWKLQGIPGRFAAALEAAAAEGANLNKRIEECSQNRGIASPSCVYGGSTPKVLVLGDSHADALVTAVAQAQSQGDAGVLQWTYSGCPFVFDIKKTPTFQLAMGGKKFQCIEFMAWAQSQLLTLPESVPVVLISRYAQAAMGQNEDKQLNGIPQAYFSKVSPHPTREFLDEFASHVTSTACELAKHRTVYMVRPIPEMGFNVPITLSRRMLLGQNNDLSISEEDYKKRNGWVWAAQDAARDQCGIKILDPTPYLCRDGRCYGSLKGRPLYHDDDHLSEFGNKLLVPMFAAVFSPSNTN